MEKLKPGDRVQLLDPDHWYRYGKVTKVTDEGVVIETPGVKRLTRRFSDTARDAWNIRPAPRDSVDKMADGHVIMMNDSVEEIFVGDLQDAEKRLDELKRRYFALNKDNFGGARDIIKTYETYERQILWHIKSAPITSLSPRRTEHYLFGTFDGGTIEPPDWYGPLEG